MRYCRGHLHHEGLITDQEYAALLRDSEAVARLEGYDATKQQAREEALEEAAEVVDHLADGEAKSYNAREEDALRLASELIRALKDTEE